MRRCTVIGSGPSAVQFALAALERDWAVDMIDVGRSAPAPVEPSATFNQLKERLDDPVAYFLGRQKEGVVLPGTPGEIYGIPPGKAYALESVPGARTRAAGFEPLFSYAQGGLAQMWTAGCYPYNDAELHDFPLDYADLAPYYAGVAQRIGINGAADDLAEHIPWHDGLQAPLRLDEHSALLLARYQARRAALHDRLGCTLGRARQAVLSADQGARKACQYLGRCIWGCPVDALYTPSLSLADCRRYPGFRYFDGLHATHFGVDAGGRVDAVYADALDGGASQRFAVETLVLACGTLNTSRLYLASVLHATGERRRLDGLMDNRQVLMPFVNLRMIGKRYQPDSYQYNQLALGLADGDARDYVHCLVTTLKTAMIHPVVEQFPVDLQTGLRMFRSLHAALGVVNVNFHDTRRADCTVSLEPGDRGAALVLDYRPPPAEAARIRRIIRRLRRVLWTLGCIAPPGMDHVRPMGASVHYAGTLPMSLTPRPGTVSADCRSHDYDNLYIADGATFPFLPAKNITFTLMANAVRVAECMTRAASA